MFSSRAARLAARIGFDFAEPDRAAGGIFRRDAFGARRDFGIEPAERGAPRIEARFNSVARGIGDVVTVTLQNVFNVGFIARQIRQRFEEFAAVRGDDPLIGAQ